MLPSDCPVLLTFLSNLKILIIFFENLTFWGHGQGADSLNWPDWVCKQKNWALSLFDFENVQIFTINSQQVTVFNKYSTWLLFAEIDQFVSWLSHFYWDSTCWWPVSFIFRAGEKRWKFVKLFYNSENFESDTILVTLKMLLEEFNVVRIEKTNL